MALSIDVPSVNENHARISFRRRSIMKGCGPISVWYDDDEAL